ncbi:sialidase family protein [Brachyspira pilosicoli]|uniref:exo-alpha-sialidase n=2 Tax=Brachyspira pilosicoli TaxID=52584 RepID=D8IFS7_BRAP9|nr:sialidase family protein [Brachyspira pilosicoli]ADK32000.1 sialidase (neuraminidase) family protein-like protein [Brachyspira pilosicoli 95/1000]
MLKKYILLLLLLLTILSCGSDYILSSFYIRKDLEWPISPSEQKNLHYYTHIVGGFNFNEYTSPVIVATPDNYILVVYENRSDNGTLDIFGIDQTKIVNINVAISKDAESFPTVGKNIGGVAYSYTASHGSPIVFVDKNGNVVVLAVGGIGFGTGNATDISTISVSISEDNGNQWSKWEDIDTNVFKSLLDEGYNRFYTTTGNGITLQNGTLVCMIDYKKHTSSNPDGAAILYSKNNGKDWELGSTIKYTGGASGKRFAKIIAERSDGKLLIAAVHNTGNDYNANNSLYWALADSLDGNISDFAVTGLPNNSGGTVAGDKIQYTENGQSKSGILLLHSYPNREYINPNGLKYQVKNAMAMSISEDDGASWKLITNRIGTAAELLKKSTFRQSMKVLKDGTIATSIEEGEEIEITLDKTFNIVYRRMGLSALSDGKYSYEGL